MNIVNEVELKSAEQTEIKAGKNKRKEKCIEKQQRTQLLLFFSQRTQDESPSFLRFLAEREKNGSFPFLEDVDESHNADSGSGNRGESRGDRASRASTSYRNKYE